MNLTNPATIPLALAGVSTLFAIRYIAQKQRPSDVSRIVIFTAVTMAIYQFCYAFETASETLAAKLVWHRIAWVGIALTPLSAILFALAFTHRRAPRWLVVILFTFTFGIIVAAETNPFHYWLETPAYLVHYGRYAMRHCEGAWLYKVFAAFAYVALLGAMVLYAALWVTGAPMYRRQARWLLLGTLAPVAVNMAYNFGTSAPIVELDLTPIMYTITLFAWVGAIGRDGLLELVPVAHDVVVASMDDPIFVMDAEFRLLDVNPAARRAFSLGERSVVGEPLQAVLADTPTLLDVIRSGTKGDVEIRGARYDLQMSSIGANAGRVVFLRNVTERARAEAAREVALREAELSATLRSEFIARMSHEFRTPLFGILGATELLDASLANDPRVALVDIVRTSAKGLLEVASDLLDFERLDDGRMQFIETPFVVSELVTEVATMLVGVTAAKSIELRVERGEITDDRVVGDPRRVRQLLVNVVGNAVKFTPRGEVVIRIASTRTDDARVAVTIEVDDTGPGFAMDTIERAFQPFMQLERTTTRRHDGAGLGLAIARRIARASGGDVTLANRVDGGARATIQLTLGAPESAESSISPAAAPGRLEGRVLVCENHPVSRQIIARMLDRLGLEYRIVESAPALLDVIDAYAPSVVLLDLHLPGMSGVDAARAIRRSRSSDVPLIAFTADARESVRRECLDAGIDGVLLKPATILELAAALADAVPNSTARISADVSHEDIPIPADVHNLYVGTAVAELTALRFAHGRGDIAEVRRIAHGLAGASAFLGHAALATACRAVMNDALVTPTLIAAIETEAQAALTRRFVAVAS